MVLLFLALSHVINHGMKEFLSNTKRSFIRNDPSTSENASIHYEPTCNTFFPDFPNEEDKSLRRESDGDTPKAINDENSD